MPLDRMIERASFRGIALAAAETGVEAVFARQPSGGLFYAKDTD